MVAEFADEVFQPQGPVFDKKMVFVTGTAADNADWMTVSGITTIEGAHLMATDGTVGAFTFATNVLTMTNGGVLVWHGIVWGV